MRNQIVALKHKADGVVSVSVPAIVVKVGGVSAFDRHITAVVPVKAADNVQAGRLAAAAHSKDGDKFLFAESD